MTSAGFQLVAGRIPGERIATEIETSDSSTFTDTETEVMSITAPLVVGRTYRVRVVTGWATDNAGDEIRVRIREDGPSGGTLLLKVISLHRTGSFSTNPWLEAEYTADATENKTFSVVADRFTGSGSVARDAGGTNPSYLYVDYIRG